MIDLAHQLIDKNVSGIFNLTSSDRLSKFDFGLSGCKFGLNSDLIACAPYDTLCGVPRPLIQSLDNTKSGGC